MAWVGGRLGRPIYLPACKRRWQFLCTCADWNDCGEAYIPTGSIWFRREFLGRHSVPKDVTEFIQLANRTAALGAIRPLAANGLSGSCA
jgi:hypothetical protein